MHSSKETKHYKHSLFKTFLSPKGNTLYQTYYCGLRFTFTFLYKEMLSTAIFDFKL